MHNRNPGTIGKLDSIFENNRRSIKPMQLTPVYAIVLSKIVHRKLNDAS
jgi:hypothetical protein